MVKQKKTKEKNYEQLSLFEFLSAESDGMGKTILKTLKEVNFQSYGELEMKNRLIPLVKDLAEETVIINNTFLQEELMKTPLKSNPNFLEKVNYIEMVEKTTRDRTMEWILQQPLFQYRRTVFHLNNELENSLSIREKYNNNMSAIEVLQNIIHEQRRATYQEKRNTGKIYRMGWLFSSI